MKNNLLDSIYYDAHGTHFYCPKDGGGWIRLTEGSLSRHLMVEEMQENERRKAICTIQVSQAVDFAGPIAGQPCGLHVYGGKKILVTEEASPVQPVSGAYPMVSAFFRELLTPPGESGEEQQLAFLGWLKVASSSLRQHYYRPGQALVLCGEPNCGKSVALHLIARVLGGRLGKPYAFMTQKTNFNAELAGCEVLSIDDEVASNDIRSRRALGQSIKSMIYGDAVQIHPKNRTPFTLRPWWRHLLACNDEPESLQILPPLDESIMDKVMVFRCGRANLPTAESIEERRAVMAQLESELPAFVSYLDNYEIPNSMKCTRNGVKSYIHPWVENALNAMSPEMKLAALIIEEFPCNDGESLTLTSAEIERRLKSNHYGDEARNLLKGANTCGVYLGRLHKRFPEAVKSCGKVHGGATKWIITPNQFGEVVR